MGLRLESILNSIFEVWGLGLGFWDLEILCRSVTIAGIESMNLVQESKKHELPCLPTLSNYALTPPSCEVETEMMKVPAFTQTKLKQ